MKARVREVVRLGKNKLGLGPSELDLSKSGGKEKEKATDGGANSTSKAPGRRSRSMGSEGWSWWRRVASNGDGPIRPETGTTARGNSYLPPPPGATLAPTLDGSVPPEPPRPDILGLKLVSG
jgi:hypothetical protein